MAVELNRGLSFELVPSQIGVVGGCNVVIGQRILQLLRVHLGLFISRGKVILIHQEPSVEKEADN